jgi:hypothetical protein
MIFFGQNSNGVSPLTTGQTSKYRFSINREEICYLQWVIEAYDGMASMRTINPKTGQIEISIAPGCRQEILSLINHLKQEGIIHDPLKKSRR